MNALGKWVVSIYAVTIALAGAFLICFMWSLRPTADIFLLGYFCIVVVAIVGAGCLVAVNACSLLKK